MRTLAILLLVLSACAPPRAQRHQIARTAPPMPPAPSPLLFSFDDGVAGWDIQNDGVMGGKSKGYVEGEDGTLVFTGHTVTDGGGFTSVIAPIRRDLTGYEGVELRVRGGGRTFELDVDDGTRQGSREVGRRGTFPTSDRWQTVRVAFADLETTVHGEPITVDPLDPAAVQAIGLYIIDGQDGPFRLEVDWMRAYRADG